MKIGFHNVKILFTDFLKLSANFSKKVFNIFFNKKLKTQIMPITADNISRTPPSHDKSYFKDEIFFPVNSPRYTTRIFTIKVMKAVLNEFALKADGEDRLLTLTPVAGNAAALLDEQDAVPLDQLFARQAGLA